MGLCTYFVFGPQAVKEGYDHGHGVGVLEGRVAGFSEGKSKGVAEVRAEDKRAADSVSAVAAQKAMREAKLRRKHVVPPQQNFAVVNGVCVHEN